MTDNIYKVPRSKWSRWTEEAREVFNGVFGEIALNQFKMLHPNTPPIDHSRWVTTAWNAAWIAADHTSAAT